MLKGENFAILSTSFSYHLSLRPLFCLFLSSGFTQVLLYMKAQSQTSSFAGNPLEAFAYMQ